MSATGRSPVRNKNDFYETPGWLIQAILPHLSTDGNILEPCAGRGAILRELLLSGVSANQLRGVEIDETLAHEAKKLGVRVDVADWLKWAVTYNTHEDVWPDLAIFNPPYSLAYEFINSTMMLMPPHGEVAALVRLNFLGSRKRAAFFRQHPCDIYVSPRRPSFTGKGTDATEYCWLVWGPGRGNRWFLLDTDLTQGGRKVSA